MPKVPDHCSRLLVFDYPGRKDSPVDASCKGIRHNDPSRGVQRGPAIVDLEPVVVNDAVIEPAVRSPDLE